MKLLNLKRGKDERTSRLRKKRIPNEAQENVRRQPTDFLLFLFCFVLMFKPSSFWHPEKDMLIFSIFRHSHLIKNNDVKQVHGRKQDNQTYLWQHQTKINLEYFPLLKTIYKK